MKTYYLRFENVYVKVDSITKEVVNVIKFPTQKSITKLNSQDYYNTIINQIDTWTIIDEATFSENYNEVLAYLEAT